MVRITLDEPLPCGIEVMFDQYDDSGNLELSDNRGNIVGDSQTLSCTTGSSVYYQVTTDTNLTEQENFYFYATVYADSPGMVQYPVMSISSTVTLAQVGTAADWEIPRYQASEVPAGPVLRIIPSTTSMLIPYAANLYDQQQQAATYQTGIAVANTTLDPGEDAFGFDGAIPQDGQITFYFYPQIGLPFEYTTQAGSPGMGLDADGLLPPGGSYTVMLADLLAAAQAPSMDFQGYIIIITNFINAHGQYFISDFGDFTNGAQILIFKGTPFCGSIGEPGEPSEFGYWSIYGRQGTEGLDH
jgi:hypothetical protein